MFNQSHFKQFKNLVFEFTQCKAEIEEKQRQIDITDKLPGYLEYKWDWEKDLSDLKKYLEKLRQTIKEEFSAMMLQELKNAPLETVHQIQKEVMELRKLKMQPPPKPDIEPVKEPIEIPDILIDLLYDASYIPDPKKPEEETYEDIYKIRHDRPNSKKKGRGM